jgi:hypothetical protein
MRSTGHPVNVPAGPEKRMGGKAGQPQPRFNLIDLKMPIKIAPGA